MKVGSAKIIKRENPFVQIDKTCLNDKRLSWKAKGLLCYMLSLPDDWEFYVTELANHSKDGRDATANAIKELINAGYIQRTKEKDSSGKFTGYSYLIYEVPANKQQQPKTENPFSDKPYSENPTLLINNNTNNKNTNNISLVNSFQESTNEGEQLTSETEIQKEQPKEHKEEKTENEIGANVVNENVIKKYPEWLEKFYSENDIQHLQGFSQQPSSKWLYGKIKELGESFVSDVLLSIESYCNENPDYIKKRSSLAGIFSKFQQTTPDGFIKPALDAINKKYNSLFSEGYQVQGKSDILKLRELLNKIGESITKQRSETATESEIIAGLELMLSKMPKQYCQPDKFKIALINYNYQQIKNEIKYGKGTNNNSGQNTMSMQEFIDTKVELPWYFKSTL